MTPAIVRQSRPSGFSVSYCGFGRRRRLAAWVSGLALVLTIVSASLADDISYDPELCPTDAGGKVYITLKGTVFAFPADQLLYIRGASSQGPGAFPQLHDQVSPEGCPRHPLEGTGFTFAYHYADLLADRTAPRHGRMDTVSLVATGPNTWGMQPLRERAFDRNCEKGARVASDVKGFEVCETHPAVDIPGGYPNDLPSSLSLKASREYYSAPFDRAFVIDCRRNVPGTAFNCHVDYKLYETVNISYSFETANIPFADVVEVDKALRTSIERALRPDLSRPFSGYASGTDE